MKDRPLEKPSLINLNHGSKIYEGSGSENDNDEENEKEDKKNMDELAYTIISNYERGEQAEQQKIAKPKNDHKMPRLTEFYPSPKTLLVLYSCE